MDKQAVSRNIFAVSGADPGFFLGGGGLVSSNKPHSFFAEYQLC